MRKIIFTLITILITASAQALPELKPERITASPHAIAAHNALVARATTNHALKSGEEKPALYRGSFMSGGLVWELSLIWLGYWDDLFASTDANGHWPEHYGKVMVTATAGYVDDFSGYRENRQIQFLLFYPTQQALLDLGLEYEKLATLFGDKANPSALVPLEYMKSDFKIFSDLKNTFTAPASSTDDSGKPRPGYFHTRYTQNSNGEYTWAILQSATLMPDSDSCYFKSKGFGSLVITDDEGIRIGGPTQYTSVEFSDYIPGKDNILAKIVGGMATKPLGKSVWNYNLPYKGSFINLMVEPNKGERNFEIGEVHIINTGMASSDTWPYYTPDYGPLHRFYLLACSPDFTYPLENFQTTEFEYEPVAINATASDYSWIRGALYSPEEHEDPYGVWNEMAITWHYDEEEPIDPIYTNAPAPFTCIEPGYAVDGEIYFWSPLDGLWLMDNGYETYYPVNNKWNEKPFVMCGTTEGFGVYGIDRYTTPLRLHYDGDIVYHYNPDDYTLTMLIPSTGDIETPWLWDTSASVAPGCNIEKPSIETKGGKGRIAIRAMLASKIDIYSLSGTLIHTNTLNEGDCINIDAAPGIYLIKSNSSPDVVKVLVR